jgi:N-acetylgalactosamine PTS system EIID component
VKNISKALHQSIVRSFFIQSAFSLNKMQTLGWLVSYLPIIRTVYDKQDQAKNAKFHLHFFNTHPWFVSGILGVCAHESSVLKSEEGQENIKTAAMGPLGGIGDALVWFVIFPIVTAISISIYQPWLSVIIFFFGINIPRVSLRVLLSSWGYNQGVPFLTQFANYLHKVHFFLKPIGMVTLGILIVISVKLVSQLGGVTEGLRVSIWFVILIYLIPKLKLKYIQWVLLMVIVEGILTII